MDVHNNADSSGAASVVDAASNAGGAAGGRRGALSPASRGFFSIALCINAIAFPIAIFGGLYTGRFPYTREIGYLYISSVIVPALILFANRLPELLESCTELVRAWRCQHEDHTP